MRGTNNKDRDTEAGGERVTRRRDEMWPSQGHRTIRLYLLIAPAARGHVRCHVVGDSNLTVIVTLFCVFTDGGAEIMAFQIGLVSRF